MTREEIEKSIKCCNPYSRMYNRLADGWSVERAFTTPASEKHINKKYKELQNG